MCLTLQTSLSPIVMFIVCRQFAIDAPRFNFSQSEILNHGVHISEVVSCLNSMPTSTALTVLGLANLRESITSRGIWLKELDVLKTSSKLIWSRPTASKAACTNSTPARRSCLSLHRRSNRFRGLPCGEPQFHVGDIRFSLGGALA